LRGDEPNGIKLTVKVAKTVTAGTPLAGSGHSKKGIALVRERVT
jgi:hypothetical protein